MGEEGGGLGELRDDVDGQGGLDYLVEFYYVWVADAAEDLDLSLDVLQFLWVV